MAPRSDDVVGFTRIFVLFMTLVLLPSLFMSGFGVVAIVNVNRAEKQRRREEGEEVLRRAEARFVETLDRSDRLLREDLRTATNAADAIARVRAQGAPVGEWLLFAAGPGPLDVDAEGTLADVEASRLDGSFDPLPAPVERVLASAIEKLRAATDAGAIYLAVDALRAQGPAGVLSLQRLGDGRIIVYAVDVDVLTSAFADLDEALQVRVRPEVADDGPVKDALERVVLEISAAAETDGLEVLVERRLDPPFSPYTLMVETPPSSSSTTIMVIYIVLLVVFLLTLITGVVITARLIYQETRLSRLKTDFVSHMSHELRTPLTSIRLFIETLKLGRAESKEEQEECLALLAKETERLSEMIERVLGYARLKAGRRVFQQDDVPVDNVVRDAIDAFRAQTLADTEGRERGAHLAFTIEVEEGLPLIRVDREAAVEALLNLIGNAWKYTGPNKRIVVFARQGGLGRRRRVLLGVRDNGPGLPKSEHARVFERFYQSRHLLSSKQPGSGLGLAITKAIVEGQGGRITVDSEPGTGSTFTIELPAA